jgi:hypothetical protein
MLKDSMGTADMVNLPSGSPEILYQLADFPPYTNSIWVTETFFELVCRSDRIYLATSRPKLPVHANRSPKLQQNPPAHLELDCRDIGDSACAYLTTICVRFWNGSRRRGGREPWLNWHCSPIQFSLEKMSAVEVIEQIRALPEEERAKVVADLVKGLPG